MVFKSTTSIDRSFDWIEWEIIHLKTHKWGLSSGMAIGGSSLDRVCCLLLKCCLLLCDLKNFKTDLPTMRSDVHSTIQLVYNYDLIWNDFHYDQNGWCHDYRHNHCRPYQCQLKTWARDGLRRLWITIWPRESLLLLEFYVDRINKIYCLAKKS